MEIDLGAEAVGLVQEFRNLCRAVRPGTTFPVEYHKLYDRADESELDAAVAAGTTMLVHFEFGDSIRTAPDVPRVCRLVLPHLCLVSFAKRAICRQFCPGMYPSFIRFSLPDSGEVLEDSDQAAAHAQHAGRPASVKRTLASYGVRNQSVLQLDIVEGNIFEAFDYTDFVVHTGAREASAVPAAAAPATEAPKAAAAAATGENASATGRVQQDGALALVTRNDVRREAGTSPRPQQATKRRLWTREESFALLRGIQKYGGGSWKSILEDPMFAKALEGRKGIDLKDKWTNLQKAANRNFQSMKCHGEDTEMHEMVLSIMELVNQP